MICNQCGKENNEGAKFCEKCGAGLGESFCPECGHTNHADAKFCKECGNDLKVGAAKTATAAKAVKKAGLSTAGKILLGVASLAIVIGGGLFVVTNIMGLSLSDFLPGSQSTSVDEPKVTKVVYTTNPATVIEESKPIAMVFEWFAKT